MDNVQLTEETFIFGEVGQAIYRQGDKYFKVSRRKHTPEPCRVGEINLLLDVCTEPLHLPYVPPLPELLEQLRQSYAKYTALQFLLNGLDKTLGEGLQRECIGHLDKLFKDEAVYQFVRQRFLSRLLPKEADVSHAIQYAKTAKVKALYQEALADSKNGINVFLPTTSIKKWLSISIKSLKFNIFKKIVKKFDLIPATVALFVVLSILIYHIYFSVELRKRADVIAELKAENLKLQHLAELQAEISEYKGNLMRRDREAWRREFNKHPTVFEVEDFAKNLKLQRLAELQAEISEYKGKLMRRDREVWRGEFDKHLTELEVENFKLRKELEEYSEVYREMIQKSPNDIVIRNSYAEILKLRNQLEASGEVYQETIQKFPNDVAARNGYAEILKLRNQLDESVKVYRETIQKFPDDVVARNSYAEILKLRNQLDESGKVYRETIQKFPKDVVARNGYAEILKLRNQLASDKVYRETMRETMRKLPKIPQ